MAAPVDGTPPSTGQIVKEIALYATKLMLKVALIGGGTFGGLYFGIKAMDKFLKMRLETGVPLVILTSTAAGIAIHVLGVMAAGAEPD